MSKDRTQDVDRSEVERMKALFLQAAVQEADEVAQLLASSADGDLLGKTEFDLRDLVHRVGAKTLEACTNERAKKRGTQGAARLASVVSRPVL